MAELDPRIVELQKVVEVETTVTLWTDTYRFVPRVVPEVFGDGKRLIWLESLCSRPRYWVAMVDSLDVDERGKPIHEGPGFDQRYGTPLSNELLYCIEQHFGGPWSACSDERGCGDDCEGGHEHVDYPGNGVGGDLFAWGPYSLTGGRQ